MNAISIPAYEAERMLGRRLDRRVSYWSRGDEICVLGLAVRSIAKLQAAMGAICAERPDLRPSANAYDRPLIERADDDHRIDLATDLVAIGRITKLEQRTNSPDHAPDCSMMF
jgi:hypothetical protein